MTIIPIPRACGRPPRAASELVRPLHAKSLGQAFPLGDVSRLRAGVWAQLSRLHLRPHGSLPGAHSHTLGGGMQVGHRPETANPLDRGPPVLVGV